MGVTTRHRPLDDQLHTCPSCGVRAARLTRKVDYLSLFFIPLIPVSRGQEFLHCQACDASTHSGLDDWSPRGAGYYQPPPPPPPPRQESRPRRDYPTPERCPACQADLGQGVAECPGCGQRLVPYD